MNIENLLSLIGGLGLFLYGMTVMGESIEKAAGAKMRSFLDFFTKSFYRYAVWYAFLCNCTVIKRNNGYGSQLCQCRTDEFGAGSRGNYGCQCRYYHYFTVGRI